ncbi:MAG: sigma-70 family RNA polymerase sigma factor, partial [Anditalea sp.]
MKSQASQIELEDVNSLWQGLRDGDRNGLEGIYRHFATGLFQYGLSIVADQDFVQDCIQEVFIDI